MIICVDFDGTMVDHRFPEVGPPVPHAISSLKTFMGRGCRIVLWTMRCDDYLAEAKDYMEQNEIVLFGANENPQQKTWTSSPKAYGNMYIDDAAIGCPLMRVEGFYRPCVDWVQVSHMVLNLLERK